MLRKSHQVFSTRDEYAEKELLVPCISSEIPATYPSDYWKDNPGKIPITLTEEDPGTAYHRVLDMVQGSRWCDVTVASFMASMIRGTEDNEGLFTIKAADKWEADGITITDKGEDVNPLNIFRISNPAAGEFAERKGDRPSTHEERVSKFVMLLLLYRKIIAKGANPSTYAETSNRVANFVKAAKLRVIEKESNYFNGYIADDKLTSSYRKIIAAVDMFLFKYPNHPLSYLRICTLPTRYRGCVACLALGQVSSAVGLEPDELAGFIYTAAVVREFVKIAVPDQGAEDVYGFFPYQIDLGITSHSPYSLGSNPTLCYWLHIIGCVVGFERSFGAKVGLPKDIPKTFTSAAVVGLSFMSSSDFQREIVYSKQEQATKRQAIRDARVEIPKEDSSDDEDDDEEDDEETTPKTKTVTEVIAEAAAEEDENYTIPISKKADRVLDGLMSHGGLSRQQRIELRNRAPHIKHTIDGTVGKHFYDIAMGL